MARRIRTVTPPWRIAELRGRNLGRSGVKFLSRTTDERRACLLTEARSRR